MKILLMSFIFTLVPFLAGCGSSGNNSTVIGAVYNDSDNDGIIDVIDVDDNNDGLIEISDAKELNNIRYNLFGTSYKTSISDRGNAEGCGDDGCNGYQLINDIDLDPNGIGVKNWDPIGEHQNPFSAIFDGGNYTIRNLIISSSDVAIGFLGAMGHFGVGILKNVRLRGGRVASTARSTAFTGSAVGVVGANGIVENVSSDLDVFIDGGYAGGLVGGTSGRIRSGYSIGNVTSSTYGVVGGLTGTNGGIVRGSYSTGTVTGGVNSGTLGGLIASNIGIITNCYSTSDIVGRAPKGRLGGVVGVDATGYIGKSYFSGTITGKTGNTDVEHIGLFTGYRLVTIISRYAAFHSSYYRNGTGAITGLDDGDIEYSIELGEVLAVFEPDLLYLTAAGTEIDFPGNGWSERSWDFSAGKYPSLKLYSADKDGNRIEGTILCDQPDTHTQC